MDPLGAVMSGIQTVGNFAGTLLNNKANKKLVRETNAQNYKMFQEQNAFNREMAFDMMQYENAYNDPAAVRERLENAGYSPFAMGDNGASFANADGSTPTAGTPTPMIAPQYQAPHFDFANSIGDLTLKAAQAKKLGADTETVEKTRDQIIKEYEINNATKQFDLELKREFDKFERTWKNEEQRARVREVFQRIKTMEQDFKNAVLDGDIKAIEKERSNILKEMDSERLKWLPKELKQQLINLVKEGGVFDSQISLNKASSTNQRAQASYTKAQEDTVNAMREPLVQAQKTGNLSNVVDMLAKIAKTPAEIDEIRARIKNLSENEKKQFAERIKTMIETGQSLFSASGSLDLPFLGDIGAKVKYGK